MLSTLRLTVDLRHIAVVRQFVEEQGARLQLPPSITDPLALAVDELANNIIVHGYRGQPGPIEVEVERTPDALIIRLRDQAPPFDPTRLPEPDITQPLEQRPEGGMGVYLARHSVDSLTHEVMEQGGNQLTLVKKISGANPGHHP